MSQVKRRKPIFKQRQEEWIIIQEGSALLLRCEVEEPLYTTVWNKDMDTIMMWQENMEQMNLSDRYKFIGNPDAGDYAIEIKSAQLDDSGMYTCQVTPRSLDENDNMEDFAVKTYITVAPKKSPPQESPAHNQSVEFKSTSAAHDSKVLQLVSQMEAGITPTGWAKLTDGRLHTTTRTLPRGPLGFANGHSPPSLLSADSHNHPTSSLPATLAFTLPYLLLALGGLFMLVNGYLIYSLIKRLKENRRRKLHTKPPTLPSKSSHVIVVS